MMSPKRLKRAVSRARTHRTPSCHQSSSPKLPFLISTQSQAHLTCLELDYPQSMPSLIDGQGVRQSRRVSSLHLQTRATSTPDSDRLWRDNVSCRIVSQLGLDQKLDASACKLLICTYQMGNNAASTRSACWCLSQLSRSIRGHRSNDLQLYGVLADDQQVRLN
jgi:hypothetical protein